MNAIRDAETYVLHTLALHGHDTPNIEAALCRGLILPAEWARTVRQFRDWEPGPPPVQPGSLGHVLLASLSLAPAPVHEVVARVDRRLHRFAAEEALKAELARLVRQDLAARPVRGHYALTDDGERALMRLPSLRAA